ncbi:MAG TPA: hypothetical protein DCZ10_15980 [Pelotomaculum sp.]|nr:hypothetical protein [Pelotomaculum sp.]
MTELEINNFAYNFINLINAKNNKIRHLKSEVTRLRAVVTQQTEPGRRLTEEEVREGKQPVYAYHMAQKTIGWVIPLSNLIGVISNKKGVYKYSDYGKTWYALSARPEQIPGGEGEEVDAT